MEPIKFEGVNVTYGENQPEYKSLPGERRGKPSTGELLTCWELRPEEIEQVKQTGKIWLSVLTFNKPLQPVLLTTEKPEIYDPEDE